MDVRWMLPVTVALACQGAPGPTEHASVEPATRRVLLGEGATLYTAPGPGGESFEIDADAAPARDVEVVGEHGEFLAIHTSPGGCYPELMGELELTVYVKRSDVLPTPARRIELSDERGSLVLFPGLLLQPVDGPGVATWAGVTPPFRVELELRSTDVSTVGYEAKDSGRPAPERSWDLPWIAMGTTVAGPGGSQLVFERKVFGLAETGARPGEVRLGLAGSCMEGELWVPETQVQREPTQLIGKGGTCGGHHVRDPWAPGGLVAYWPDGTRAGRLREGHGLRLNPSISEVNGLSCFAVDHTGRSSSCREGISATVCFKTDELRTVGEAG